jgi:GNAT superfamily N-acetyltransferase
VFILEEYRGLGLSKLMMQAVVEHSALQGLRRWMLLTRNAHGLYKKVGFTEPKTPERYMERVLPDVYQNEKS